MRNYIYLLAIVLFLGSCASTKELQNQNQNLNGKVSELQTDVSRLNKANELLKTNVQDLGIANKKINSELSQCNSELQEIASIYASYSSKIKKMKSELESAFPNNLRDENFSIVEEDGRLIVRLPNRILYKSGNAEFNSEALLVLQKLSKIFEANPALNVLVEGHTDDIPLKKGSKYADNWDLSLARAVKVVRQLQTYGVYPQQLTAAGRANYVPLDRIVSEEARAKNRRTEIIIRPKISDVIKAMSELN